MSKKQIASVGALAKASVPSTASAAATILAVSGAGFVVPTAAQKRNILVALAKANKVVYGRAYDIIKIRGKTKINLSNAGDVEKNIDRIQIYEIKSTNRSLDSTFEGYFFSLSTAELLVAQSLGPRFKFVFVNITTQTFVELTLAGILRRTKAIYPSWSIRF